TTLDTIPNVVTTDIKVGIEKHIEELSEANGGFFPIAFDGKQMKLKLVRVHMEYLANLGPRRHFACVDLASEDGNVYDVDFFLEGDPGNMTVTETTVHKLNGRPFYLWREQEDGVWVHVEADDASRELLGVKEGDDAFEFTYQATLPTMAEPAKMWIPIPTDDQFQEITMNRIEIPGEHQILTEEKFGNQILYVELQPEDSGKTMVLHFDVKRQEKAVFVDDTKPELYLLAETMVPLNEKFKTIARNALKDKNGGDLVRARALYDHTIDSMKYAKFGSGWGQGNANFACDSARGNCTDYHSYFIALCRASNIPARFAIGAAVPSSRDNGGVNGYHCWAEFYAEGKWWPVDISEADKYAALATYYFGHNPANRVEFSRGRDLIVEPGPESGPINFLAYPLLEVGGKPVKIKPQFGFKRG
ncbi:MAG: transglutaminase domain-containing protein, partial [Phycisphaerales bacterium]|nr:transglutaminase domain-containing protein [Phycisphaerales bacterium]